MFDPIGIERISHMENDQENRIIWMLPTIKQIAAGVFLGLSISPVLFLMATLWLPWVNRHNGDTFIFGSILIIAMPMIGVTVGTITTVFNVHDVKNGVILGAIVGTVLGSPLGLAFSMSGSFGVVLLTVGTGGGVLTGLYSFGLRKIGRILMTRLHK